MEKIIKIILAVLFFLCLLDMPYGYFQFVRYLGMLGFIFLAYKSFKENFTVLGGFYIGLAILFQPFFKIALGRTIWNFVDVAIALFLIVSIIKFKNEK